MCQYTSIPLPFHFVQLIFSFFFVKYPFCQVYTKRISYFAESVEIVSVIPPVHSIVNAPLSQSKYMDVTTVPAISFHTSIRRNKNTGKSVYVGIERFVVNKV